MSERDNRPADDGDMSAGTVPLSLTEELHQRQDGCWVRQLSWRPAAQLQESHHPLPPLSLLHLQSPLCDVSMNTLL